MRILGIDPSLTGCGLAVIEDGRLTLGKVVKTPADWPEGKRLDRIRQEVIAAIAYPADPAVGIWLAPTAVAIEGYARDAKYRREEMGQVGGAVKLALYEHGYVPAIWSPGSWRKMVLGNGRVRKDQVVKEVYKRHGFDTDDHNIAEAFCIATAEYMVLSGTAERPTPRKKKAA